MSLVNDIRKLLDKELTTFESIFRESLKSNVSLLDKITHYIVKRKGKQMRPMFVLLSAKLFGELQPSAYRAATLVELLHTATLVHDDVVDDAMERRGFLSINAIWKNKIAVLVGDYLLSRSLIMSVENKEFALLGCVSRSVKEMSEGELLQMEKSRKLNQDEDVYYDIIQKKTASLISACCEAGSIAAAVPENVQNDMRLFGEYVGMAFQIKDDLFDYQPKSLAGKASFADLKERKLTLPIIHALSQVSDSERKSILRLVNKKRKSKAQLFEILDFVTVNNGLTYSEQKMKEYADKALTILATMPDNEYRKALHDLVIYTIERKK